MAATKKAATAAKVKDAPTEDAPKPHAAAKPDAKPPVPEARALFVDEGGKTLSGTMAVFAVSSRYDEAAAAEVASTGASGVLKGMPRLVELVGLFPTTSHTGAAKAAREAGLLGADQDAVTLNARFVSAVNVPRDPEPDAAAAPQEPAAA